MKNNVENDIIQIYIMIKSRDNELDINFLSEITLGYINQYYHICET